VQQVVALMQLIDASPLSCCAFHHYPEKPMISALNEGNPCGMISHLAPHKQIKHVP